MSEKEALAPGTRVTVLKLKKSAVVTKCLSKGRYEVLLGNLKMSVREEELELSAPARTKKNKRPKRTFEPRVTPQRGRKQLDLHGCSVAEGERKLEQALNEAVLKGYRSLEIIHGKGSGKIREMTNRILNSSEIVASHSLDPANAGTTIAYLYER